MLTDRQTDIMLTKLKRYEATLESLLFDKVDEVSMKAYPTDGQYHEVPASTNFKPCKSGDSWVGEGSYCWFLGEYRVPDELDSKMLYVYPKIEGYEGLLWVDGKPYGNFGTKIQAFGHGNHYCDMLKKKANKAERIEIAMEFYAHHYVIGTQPFQTDKKDDFKITYHSVDICVKNEDVWDAYFNLLIVNQMVEGMNRDSFRRAELINTLHQVHELVYYDYDNADRDTFIATLQEANQLLEKVLAQKNSDSAPYAGLIGHSHMDTAWLWDIKETVKKCARTYSNQMNLMDQYPEYKFVQSSAFHAVLMKEAYPELFEAMKKQVAAGRYEPNGAVFIECDCNIPSGEAMIRQFLWGQRYTREYFGYTSDTFWLPDTFGYSASLPQIMKGCGVRYFLTTKLNWGDTTEFPYDTFFWKGIDGSEVFVHFNKTHTGPEPKYMLNHVFGNGKDSIKEKRVTNMRLLSYGEGDGGGGPTFEMIEVANRLADVEGLPKSSHITVSEFMNRLEHTSVDASTYTGELYLELHRGTLTNQHTIKRNNRLAEIALRNLEYITVRDAIQRKVAADGDPINPLMRDLLVNQFHDILPGTCVPAAHDQAISETDNIIKRADRMIETIVQPSPEKLMVSVINTLSFARQDVIYLDYLEGYIVKGDYRQQIITDIHGEQKLAVSGITIPAFASVVLELVPGVIDAKTVFCLEGNLLESPFARVEFDEKGYIHSFIDKRERRELRGEGYPLNTLLIAEDVPSDWDNWDLDADIECKFKDAAVLLSRNVISVGEVECRIRSEYRLTANSLLKQDMIFYADSAEVRFDTVMDWRDHHRFLKTAFDTSIHAEFARHEIQFGYLMRPTNRNTPVEKAKFEVSNHKYTDLSENRYGVAIFNDCKYGISVQDSKLRLSLHKGGCRPDYRGDQGEHSCSYSFYPHNMGFQADSVIKPAYRMNYKPIILSGEYQEQSLIEVSASNIIIETVKPLEEKEKAFILRMYEAEGTYTNATLVLPDWIKGIAITNMLEEQEEVLSLSREVELNFSAFEIKTIKINY
jgi:alpha-mannosidase